MTTLQHAIRSHSFAASLPALLSARAMAKLFALSRQRQALGKLDDSALLDIGLDRAEAACEARRPVWDVPAHWLK